MSKHDRGVYEPSPEDIRPFDGGEGEIDEEGSRLPLLIVIALLVLAAFVGVVWLAYTQGVQRGREGAPPTIAADQGPVRTEPENPGGKTPYQGLKIYEQPAPAEDDSTPAETATMPAPAAPVAAPAIKPEAPALSQAQSTTKSATKSAAESGPKAEAEAAKPAPAKPAPVKAAPPKPAPAAEAATGGDYVLQIGAYKSQDEANAAWKAYQRKHPIVGGYGPDILRVDLGAKGVWYRLRIGSFADRAAASSFCAKLTADGGGCFPAKK